MSPGRASLAPGEREAVERDAGGDARAAVGDELARRSSGSGSFQGALSAPGMRPGTWSIGFGSPRQRVGHARIHHDELASRAASSSASIVSSVAWARHEIRGLDLFLAARSGPCHASRSITPHASWP